MPSSLPMEQFPPLVREFGSYKLGIQGCSPKTVTEYLMDLRTFFRFLIASREGIDPASDAFLSLDISHVDLAFLQSVTPSDIYSFLYYTGDVRRNLWNAKARKLSAIKGFYKYLVNKRALLETNPARDIESPKPKKTLPKVLSLEESLSLLQVIKEDETSETRIRDYCIVTLFLNCGMRLSELAGIQITDLDSELRSLRVTGKGSKERIIYLNDACRLALGDYLTLRLDASYRDVTTRALFLSGRGRNQPISVKTIQWMVKRYLSRAGLDNRGYSVHKLRHTAATLMYQSGNVDVRTLKDILGHEQLNTTQIYTHVSNKNMEDAMAQNPLAAVKPPAVHTLQSLPKDEPSSPEEE